MWVIRQTNVAMCVHIIAIQIKYACSYCICLTCTSPKWRRKNDTCIATVCLRIIRKNLIRKAISERYVLYSWVFCTNRRFVVYLHASINDVVSIEGFLEYSNKDFCYNSNLLRSNLGHPVHQCHGRPWYVLG